jgi:para-nitrobenzyl esterase
LIYARGVVHRLTGFLLLCVGCGDDGPPVGPNDAGALDAGFDAALPPPPEVTTSGGTVVGTLGVDYYEFLGIPYAAPPIGERRWRAPDPPEPFGRRESTRPKACPQRALSFDIGEEDCLYVNVHTPAPLPSGAPVMVWIHGGAFIFGEGLQTDNGTRGDVLAAEHGVIVVSMNYRLGAFGFLAHEALTAADGTSGNYGFADQVAALRWVQENIAAFGGDPDNVTIFGESAGGLSVCLHLISPESEGLFARAISESGLCDEALGDLASAETYGAALFERGGCADDADPVACMRAKTRDEIIEIDTAATGMTALTAERQWWPAADGARIPAIFRERVAAGELHEVPTLFGWNADEGTLFVMLAETAGVAVDEAAYREGITSLAERHAVEVAAVEAQYPIADYPDPGAALAAALGDATLACPSRRAALLLRDRALVRVYRFEYPDAPFQLPAERELGAFHSAEIQYVFGHPAIIGSTSHRGDDLTLHQAMSGYWARFARSGDPNGAGAVEWPIYDGEDRHLVLDRTITTGTAADRDRCALWEPTR